MKGGFHVRVSKSQIVNGVVSFIQGEILPKMDENRSLQIVLSVAMNAVKANDALIDKIFGNEILKALLEDDGSGKYEIGKLFDTLRETVEEYGVFSVNVPAIPFVCPEGSTIKLHAADISAIRRRIEGAEPEVSANV